MDNEETAFCGAKLCLTRDGRLLTLLRDDFDHIPFPAHWDLPGGGREGRETPVACALRELAEEFGLRLAPGRLRGHVFPSFRRPELFSWLFTGQLSLDEIAAIRFGDEGQGWRMMPIAEFVAHSRAVPHFRDWVKAVTG